MPSPRKLKVDAVAWASQNPAGNILAVAVVEPKQAKARMPADPSETLEQSLGVTRHAHTWRQGKLMLAESRSSYGQREQAKELHLL